MTFHLITTFIYLLVPGRWWPTTSTHPISRLSGISLGNVVGACLQQLSHITRSTMTLLLLTSW